MHFNSRSPTRTKKRESFSLRYLVNGRPGSRSAAAKAALSESTIQETSELATRLLPATKEDEVISLNTSKDDEVVNDEEDKNIINESIQSDDVFVDFRSK